MKRALSDVYEASAELFIISPPPLLALLVSICPVSLLRIGFTESCTKADMRRLSPPST